MIRKTEILTKYEVICLNPKGVNGKEPITTYYRRVLLNECKKCKYFKGYNMKKLEIKCNYLKSINN